MASTDIGLIAHLMRRAGFGARYDELTQYAALGYDATVEWLLHPEREPEVDEDVVLRYTPFLIDAVGTGRWIYRMLNTRRPLEEKIALFWHCIFATGVSKLNHGRALYKQYEMFRRNGMGDLRTLLVELARDPAMIYWLDNCDNHKDAPNENWGRELLELFSMGIGNYTESDVQMAARAFTGWTYKDPLPRVPHRYYYSGFEYRPWDHDDGEKTFLGETGRFNGEDIIDIIVRQPATARFVARHLYNFFVADEPQVPAWATTPPNDPDAVELLAKTFTESKGELRPVLEVLFTSDFFKEANFLKVKSPVELVVGASVSRETTTPSWARFPRTGWWAWGPDRKHGPDGVQPTQRRRLAHRQGVDRQRCAGAEGQLRIFPGGRRDPTRDTPDSRPAGRAGGRAVGRGAGERLSRVHGRGQRRRGHAWRAGAACGQRRRVALRHSE